ncbi:MAG: glutathione S-transferase family protein [Acidobacteriota bacterium]|nr:glutathione S-transferase family protein [Acidobacteriota bacterium]
MAIRLFHFDRSPLCEKVRLALALEGLAYESVTVDPSDTTIVREISGNDELPLAVFDDDEVVQESNRILRHLAARPGSKLLPDGRRDQALTWVLVDRADAILGPLVYRLVCRKEPDGHDLSDDDLGVLDRRLGEEIGVLEGLLERGPFVFGERPTLADVAIHAYLNRLPRVGNRPLPGDALRVSSWYERVEKATTTTS